MLAIWKFRFLALLLVLFVGGIAAVNLAAELLRPAQFPMASKDNKAPLPDQISAARRASEIAPFRSDLRGQFADALASLVLFPQAAVLPDSAANAQDTVRSALKVGPHDSRLWLLLATLQARGNPTDPWIAEPLKMSYLTGPNAADLIPVRLQAVTAANALADSDLNELARSDVRALLTKLVAQKQTLLDDYRRGSELGKKFLEQSVGAIDPEFVPALRAGKK